MLRELARRIDAFQERLGRAVSWLMLAMVLVVGAGLMTESLWRLSRVDLGFDQSGVLSFRIQPSSGQIRSPEEIQQYFDQMTQRIAALPGVSKVGAAQHLPLSGFTWRTDVDIEKDPLPAAAEHPRATWRSVTGACSRSSAFARSE